MKKAISNRVQKPHGFQHDVCSYSSALGRSFNSDCVREAAIGGHYRVRCDANYVSEYGPKGA